MSDSVIDVSSDEQKGQVHFEEAIQDPYRARRALRLAASRLLRDAALLYTVAFLGGVAGSLHCIGMCGGFPLALARARTRNLPRQLLYNAGRLNALAFVGAVSGGAGAAVAGSIPLQGIERALAIVAGVLIVLVGLEMLGLVGRVSARLAALTQRTLTRWLGGAISSPSPLAPLALGVFNAFLPCHLIYAFAARAAATASALEGALLMLAFGAGTLPAMLVLGATRVLARPALRARLSLASGALVLAFGVVTLLRGLLAGATHVH
ncbi:MAG: sulfite exporter TauE/SafE family protein [Thermodesulfobacteriota bacterium]